MSDAQPDRRGQAHGVLQVEKVVAMSQSLQLGGYGAHDGDDDTTWSGKLRIHRA
jgi:hypothetical protein